MSFTTNPYCDVQQVISAIDPQSTQLQTTDTSWVQELIIEAQGAIDTYLGFSFQTDGSISSPAQRLYDGTDENEIMIDPCISITSVLEETRDITTDVVLGSSSELIQQGYSTRLRRRSGLPFIEDIQNYTVNGVFGYPRIPPLISRACIRLCAQWYKMRDTNYADEVIEQGRVRIIYNKTLAPDIMQILDEFKPRRFYSR
jgi:hypothetical protein